MVFSQERNLVFNFDYLDWAILDETINLLMLPCHHVADPRQVAGC
jgi:hypothetical protein